jgi:hypothetical protein
MFIEATRSSQKTLMAEREKLIDEGVRHITPAMEESEQHKETDYG